MDQAQRPEFEAFVNDVEPRLRRALVAAYGFERGREATADALSWSWEHWGRVGRVSNQVAYLFRVGQSTVRRRKVAVTFAQYDYAEPWFEPGLGPALAALSERQRIAVVLIHGFDWTMREVAELTGIRITTVQSHLERGLRNLRITMGVPTMLELREQIRELIESGAPPVTAEEILANHPPTGVRSPGRSSSLHVRRLGMYAATAVAVTVTVLLVIGLTVIPSYVRRGIPPFSSTSARLKALSMAPGLLPTIGRFAAKSGV